MAELTGEQITLITETWAIIENDKEIVGKAVFTGMFEAFPDYLQFFGSYNISGGGKALIANEKFARDHIVGTVMRALSKLVSNIENGPALETILSQLAKNHSKRKITQQHFENIKVVIATVVKNHLGSKWTPEVEGAWTIFLNNAFILIYKGL